MSNDTLRADQIAFHFYTKLFYIVNQARATEDAASTQKTDKWFNLETPDSDLFTKEEREPYRAVSLAPFPGPPTLEIDVLLSIPELTNNQVLVYMPPDSSRVRIEPTPKFILLETWSLGMTFHRPGSASDQHRDTSPDALPIIYKYGIILFRSVYSLLRVLPAWKFYKRLKRKISGFNRKGNLSIKLRVRNPGESETGTHILGFNARLSPTYRTPLPTSRHDFQAVPHLLGSFTLSTTYLTTPNFQLDELESILSSKFISLDLEGFVPTLDKNRQRDSLIGSSLPNSGSGLRSMLARSPPRAIARASSGNGGHGGAVTTDIADRFILPSRIPSIGGAPTLGMTASSGTSALIPPPRPFPTMNNPNPNPLPLPNTSPLVATSPYSIPSPIPPTTTTSGPASAVNRLRKESLNNSVSSSSSISTRDAQHGQVAANNNAGTSSSLSTSPVPTTSGALPIRRPTINPVHPFKSGTFSSTSGSSPSLSIRQGIGGSGGGVHGGGGTGTGTGTGAASSPVGVPSSLSGAGGTTRPVSPHGAQSHGTHSRQPSSASPIGRGIPPPPSPMGHGAHHHSPSSAGAGAGAGAGAVFPSPSSLSDRDRRPGTSGSGASGGSLDRDRERRGSVGSGFGAGGGGGGVGGAEDNLEGRSPVMNMPPPRKRYSSSFGHRYGGAGGSGGSATGLGLQVGSANSNHSGGGGGGVGIGGEEKPPAVGGGGGGGGGGGSTPASGRNTPALEGRKEGNPSFLGEGTTDDDEISIFVQDIDSRKPLSGRTKEREKRDRDRDRQREEFQRRDRDRDRDDDDDDKDYWRYDQRAHGHEPQREHDDTSPTSGQGQNKGKGKEREKEHPEPSSQWDDWHQPLSARRRLGDDARDATTSAPPVSLPLPVSTPDSIPLAQREQERERERAAQMSISPTRGGAMLTSQNEVEERLKKMNEAFFKSLEGLSAGSVRRKERQKEKEKDNAKDLKEKEKEGSSPAGMTSTPSSERGGMGMGSTGGNASRAAQGYGLGLGGVGFPSRGSGGGAGGAGARASDPSRVDYPSPSPYQYTSPSSAAPGLGHGQGHGHGLLERGRYSSTSSSTLATSEIGTSQGSEEVIGRLELYDEPSLRRRKG